MAWKWILVSLVVWFGSSGCCHALRDECDETMIWYKDRWKAHRAWRERKDCYGDVWHEKHFKRGFTAGYTDVAAGGTGCLPALPPRGYWTACHQNPDGHEKVMAWSTGYSYGVLAAEEDGIALWNQVAVTRPDYHQPWAAPPAWSPGGPAPGLPVAEPPALWMDAGPHPDARFVPPAPGGR